MNAAQTDAEFLGKVMGALTGGGGGGGGSGGGSSGCAQNTPAINIIDNARIMMLPGSVPGAMMAQSDTETAPVAESTTADTCN